MGLTIFDILMRAAFALGLFIVTTSAATATNYGAIAYSPSTGAHAYSYDYPTRRGAESRAMSECASRGRGCKTVIWFKNACAALATGSNGWGTAWAGSRRVAEQQAIGYCSNRTRGCSILVWTCTTR
ncbi:MAG: DUF4189 domain-containing protein [Hoeflea sp.]|uniref:DUF4189 domain-containing protein n=1 Tax=Hoeflea sp. TaxID=1940281 RepID=UPI003EF74114